LTIGLLADCQYAPVPTPAKDRRQYLLAAQKLADCVAELNSVKPDFAVHLGDFIDRGWDSYRVVNPIFAQLNAPRYQVLGNHDFDVAPEKKVDVPGRLGVPAPFYAFAWSGWRFLVLDGNQISLQRYPKGSPSYSQVQSRLAELKTTSPNPQALQTYNGGLGKAQQTWLDHQLSKSQQRRQPVIVFCHFPVFPASSHVLWDADEVLEILDRYPHVAAWINGHNHDGHYAFAHGVHCVNLKGMVETNENAFAVLKMCSDRMELQGYGRQESMTLSLHRPRW
jgi:predicted phosphodiesterase